MVKIDQEKQLWDVKNPKTALTLLEENILRNIDHNGGYGTQFAHLQRRVGYDKEDLNAILFDLQDRGIIVRRIRNNRTFIYIHEQYWKSSKEENLKTDHREDLEAVKDAEIEEAARRNPE